MPIVLNPSDNFERVHIKARIYPATLTAIREIEIHDNLSETPGAKKKMLAWAFDIVGKEKTVTVEGMTSYAFGPKSKARPWVKALLGGGEVAGPIDVEELIGNPCQVKVEDRERNGEKYSGVADVIAVEPDGEEPPF